MKPILVPPPVTTAEKLDTLKSLEALRSSFDLTDGLSENVLLVTLRFGGFEELLTVGFRPRIEGFMVKRLSIVVLGEKI